MAFILMHAKIPTSCMAIKILESNANVFENYYKRE